MAGADGVGLRYSIGPTSASDWQSVMSYDLINPITYEQLLFPGKVLSQTDASGRMTTYTYSYPLAQDGSQLDSVLASVTDPYGNVTAYHYYGENSQAPCDATKGELRDSLWYTENPLGDKTYYSYTADDTYTYPYLNVDGTYRYEYVDYSGLPKGLVLDTWRLVGNTKVYQSRNYYYTSGDHKGELWKTVDTAGVTTEYVYSFSDGGTADDLSDDRQIAEVRRWTNANGTQYVRESYTASDLLGRVRLTRDANGKETKTEYDAFGRVFKTTDQCNNDTFYDYNAAGQLVCTRYADGTQTCTVYDKQGRVEWTTDRYLPGGALHNGTHSFYDSLGRAYRTDRVKNLSVIIEFDADIYNANGVKVLWSRPGTSTPTTLSSSQSFYNDQGEVVKQTGADGQSTSTTTDTGPENATIGTTGYASRQTTTDALGNTTTSATDVYNTSTKTWTHGSVTVDALGHATTADYDALGRAVKVTYADRSFAETLYSLGTEAISRTGLTAPTAAEGWPGIPAGGSEVVKIEQRKSGGALVGTYYLYDKAGNLSDLWLPAVVDGDPNSATYNQPVRPHWHYTYDANGNQLSQVDPEGHTTSFTYDEFGQRLSRTLPAVSSTTVTETWTYDGFGRMRTHTDFDGQVTMYVYDNDTGLADAPTCKGADLPDAPDTAGYSSRLSGDSKRWA